MKSLRQLRLWEARQFGSLCEMESGEHSGKTIRPGKYARPVALRGFNEGLQDVVLEHCEHSIYKTGGVS
jgi:hypothetical protein